MKIHVGKLYQTITHFGSYDRGYFVPDTTEVVKIIAVTGSKITYQTLSGDIGTIAQNLVKPLPKHFQEAI